MKSPKMVIVLAAAFTSAVLLAGCSSSGDGSSSNGSTNSTPSASVVAADTIVISNYGFSKNTVTAGATIKVTNQDSVDHTLKIDGTNIDIQVGSGSTQSFTAPAKPGTYKLACDFHPAMHGSLTVTK